MDYTVLAYGLGSVLLFQHRALLPAFLTALALRFGPMVPAVRDVPFVAHFAQHPPWFTHWLPLTILGVLAAFEIAATKSADVRQFLNGFHKYMKALAAGLTTLGLLDNTTLSQLQVPIPAQADLASGALALAVAVLTLTTSSLWQWVLGTLAEHDQDDDLGLQRVISWAEDLWVLLGIAILIILPLVIVVLLVLAAAGLVLCRRYLQWHEDQCKAPCPACGARIYPSAMSCPACKAKVTSPRAIGFFGQPKPWPAEDLDLHRLRLVEKKRCPVCATRLTANRPQQTCAFGHNLFADQASVEAYLQRIRAKKSRVLWVCFFISAVPILGWIIGTLYYRALLVAPFRQYTPWSRKLFIKLALRLLRLLLIPVQAIPGIGAVVIPAVAWLEYRVYERAFRGMALRNVAVI